jgi:protein-S-isoprenylcysteine O-methyltransferase Ste14
MINIFSRDVTLMTEETSSGKALRFLEGFKTLIGVGLPLLFVSLLLEVIAIIVRRWISLPVSLTINIRIILTFPCILVSVVGLIWFNCSLNLVKLHFLNGDKKLITSGPFNYVRHPLYSALLMGLPPLLIIWYADLLFIIPWLLMFIISHYLVQLEERELIDTFGDGYKNYKKYVPALIPYKGAGGRRYREQSDDIVSGER